MFDLHRITVTNFRSYKGEHTFEFPTAAGLYFLTGKSDLDGNGAGKSTFLDAITWILYGKTTRGLKANEVITWGASTCRGRLELTAKTRMVVERTQKPTGLFLNGKPVDQEELQKHIVLNFESFLYSILVPQFGEPFFNLTPSNKLLLFSDIMKLDYWIGRSNDAANMMGDIEANIAAYNTSLTRKGEKITLLKDDVTNLNKWIMDYDSNKIEKLKIIERDAAELELDLKAINTTRLTATLRKKIKHSDGLIDSYLQLMQNCSKEKAEYVGEIKALTIPKAGSICPTCRQGIPEVHAKAHRDRIVDLEYSIAGADEDIQLYTKQIAKEKLTLSSLMGQLEDCEREELKAATLKRRLGELEREWNKTNSEDNPYIQQRDNKTLDINQTQLSYAYVQTRLLDMQQSLAEHDFWVKGFKRIRLFIIEQAFQTLELEVNNCLTQLGMSDWQISFDVERENKSGGITKGFVVFIKSPANTEPVRWENWSGGESQRLQLAGTLGLANLIMSQNGLTSEIEFFDEPSTHLSQEGMLDLANMLHERAVNERKRIWIVDHTTITNFGDFQGIITAEKGSNGSSITCVPIS